MIEKLKEDLESITSKYNDTNRSLEIVQAECLELKSAVSRKDVKIFEHVKGLKSLSKGHNEALDELKQTKQCLEEERKLLKCQESEARAIIEDLKEKLVVLEGKSAYHAEALSLLEEKIKSLQNDEKVSEELSEGTCEQQREEKKALEREDLLGLLTKIVLARQQINFLRRHFQHRVVPKFIKRKRLHEICGQPEDSQQVRGIEIVLLRAALRSKQNEMFARMKMCATS